MHVNIFIKRKLFFYVICSLYIKIYHVCRESTVVIHNIQFVYILNSIRKHSMNNYHICNIIGCHWLQGDWLQSKFLFLCVACSVVNLLNNICFQYINNVPDFLVISASIQFNLRIWLHLMLTPNQTRSLAIYNQIFLEKISAPPHPI